MRAHHLPPPSLAQSGPLEPGEHGATPFQGFAVPFAKLEPLLREAVALLREGFAVPVPGGANTPPSALMLSHLQHEHKDFYEFMAKGEKVNWEECVGGEGGEGLAVGKGA